MMYAEDAAKMIASNKASLRALESIHTRHPEFHFARRVQILREVIEEYDSPDRICPGGTIWADGAANMTVEQVCDCIVECAWRRMVHSSIRRHFGERGVRFARP